jgi:hypothetical protein
MQELNTYATAYESYSQVHIILRYKTHFSRNSKSYDRLRLLSCCRFLWGSRP